jgi:hypothetical protein
MTTEEKLGAIKEINQEVESLDLFLKNLDKGDFFQVNVEINDEPLRETLGDYWRARKALLLREAEELMK